MRAASLIGLALLACSLPAAPAGACVYSLWEERLGPPPTPEELAAEARQHARGSLREATVRARQAWRTLPDGPAELAEMLVPNVRAIPILPDDCGHGEVDYGSDKAEPEDWLAGTRYAGRAKEFETILRALGDEVGSACNREVRRRFATQLRRRLTPTDLRAAYVFLAARRSGFDRVASFYRGTRHPPLQWMGRGPEATRQIGHWLRSAPTGRALERATDEFWADNGPLLGDDDRLCPIAAAGRRADRAEILRRIDAEVARRSALNAPGS